MREESKTKKQMIEEVAALRRTLSEAKALGIGRNVDGDLTEEVVGILDAILDGLTIINMQGEILHINAAATKQLGYSREEALGKTPAELFIAEKDKPKFYENLKRLHSGNPIKSIEYTGKHKDGTEFPAIVSLSVIKNSDDNPVKVVAVHTDITERKRAEEELKESEEKFRSLAENTQDYIMRYDEDCRHLYENPAALRISGMTEEDIIGKTHREAGFDEKLCDLWEENITTVFKTGKSSQSIFEWEGAKGKVFLDWRLYPEFDESSHVKTVLGISRDITDQKLMEKKLEAMSITDELTGLNNRRGFFAFGERLLKLAKREKTGLFMLYGDLDGLKGINDIFGHNEGDNALIDFANILKTTHRDTDIIGRIGGDEFAVLLAGTTGDCVEKISARLHEKIVLFNATHDRRYNLSISVGITYFAPESPSSLDQLLAQVDKKMYEQKMRKNKS